MSYFVKNQNKQFYLLDSSGVPEARSETISGLIGAIRTFIEVDFVFTGGIQTGTPVADSEQREKEGALSPKHHAEFWNLYHNLFIRPWMCAYQNQSLLS